MEVNHYLEPLSPDWISYPGISDGETLGENIIWFDGSAEWLSKEKFDVAIVGIPEIRNCQRLVSGQAPEEIRRWLYGMRNVASQEIVADLGNIRGNSLNDRYLATSEVVEFLENRGVMVLVLGGSQDLTIPVCGFIEKTKRNLSLAVVDAFIDYDPSDEDFSESGFLNKLIADIGPERIEDINLLGTQTYFCSERQEQFLSENHFRFFRLKELRDEKIGDVEILLRQMEVLSFDFSAIKGQPVLPEKHQMPNGFSEQEACRILWYAGASDVLKVAGIFNFPESKRGESSQGPFAAQLCWHFLEGRGTRCDDYPLRPIEDYELKVVYIEEYDETLKFFYNPDNGRWWVLVPARQSGRVIPCGKEDYQMAMNQELPAVWWHYFIKNREDQA